MIIIYGESNVNCFIKSGANPNVQEIEGYFAKGRSCIAMKVWYK